MSDSPSQRLGPAKLKNLSEQPDPDPPAETWTIREYAPVGEGRGGTTRWRAVLVGPQPTNNLALVPASLAAQATTRANEHESRAARFNTAAILSDKQREAAEREGDELREALERAKALAATWRATGDRLKGRHWFTRADELDTALDLDA